MEIMYIAYCAPYSNVLHAGGQTLYYYLTQMRNEGHFVRLVSLCYPEERLKIDVEKVGIISNLVVRPSGIKKFINQVYSLNSKFNPLYKYGNSIPIYLVKLLLNELKNISKQDYEPDIIVLEWTQMVVVIEEIKKIFPNAKYVASEHDVTYLRYYREIEYERNFLKRIYRHMRYKNQKRKEITALKKCDLIFVHSQKDKKILNCDNSFHEKQLSFLVPYYHRSDREYKRENNDIIFFGNMSRVENIISVEWFKDKVMPLLADINVRFVIVGSGISRRLSKLESENVHVEGFVPSIDNIFSEAFCFVAPLQLGAGIKVKVIEALYSGITVIANDIAIEGISAKNKKDFYLCNTPEEFAYIIRNLYHKTLQAINGKKFIIENFSMDKSFKDYEKKIKGLMEEK